MNENEQSRLNNEEILKRIETFLSDHVNNPKEENNNLSELINEVVVQNETTKITHIKADEITFKFEELNYSSLVGVLLFNKDFVIEEANKTAVRLLTRNNHIITGDYFGKFIAKPYQKAFDSYVEFIKRTKQRYDRLFQFAAESGEESYFILETIPITNDKQEIVSLRAIIIDTTEQKLSDIRRQSELILRAVENMLDPFAILKAERDETNKIVDFIYLYINSAATKANQLSKEEVIGRKLLEISPSLKGSEIFEEFIIVVETDKPLMKEGVYMEFQNKHQTIKGIFDTRVNKLSDGFFITFRDITERKEAENKLAAAMKELERSNRELEQFAYITSHDLQEPLRTVTQFSSLLSERYKGKFDPNADEYFEFIFRGTNRMLSLLTDLLKYARISAQGKPLQLTDFNVIAQEVLDDLNFLIDNNNVNVIVEPLPVLMSDPVEMRQVFQNIIENAVKFRNNKDTIIKISADKNSDEFVFSINDNGIGIDAINSERIFLIFQRLHSSEKYPGTGMGLAICKKIVERHGGRIWVESEPGKGSTFYFTIPVSNTSTKQ